MARLPSWADIVENIRFHRQYGWREETIERRLKEEEAQRWRAAFEAPIPEDKPVFTDEKRRNSPRPTSPKRKWRYWAGARRAESR